MVVRFQCKFVKKKFAIFGHKRILAQKTGSRNERCCKERNASDNGFNLRVKKVSKRKY